MLEGQNTLGILNSTEHPGYRFPDRLKMTSRRFWLSDLDFS